MKTIVYTQRVEVVESYNERRDCADQRIAEFISACGFLPIPVPNNAKMAIEIVESINPAGIILVGGNSLVKYGGNAPERDATDMALIEYAEKHKKPLYGFCRGMQSILDYYGNDLKNVTGHVAVRHLVTGTDERVVNSYHNQASTELNSDSLQVLLRAEDGVIEMIRHKELPILGTMWHPERENPFEDADIENIKMLIGGLKK